MKDINKKRIISIVGAGGKTSLILRSAKWLHEKGHPVVITTTTHLYEPLEGYYREDQTEEIQAALKQGKIVWVGEPSQKEEDGRKKIIGISEKSLKELFRLASKLDASILIEADGAKHFPCKVPAGHEPVIPKETELVIGVVGLDCLGKPLKKACFRAELAAGLLGTDVEHCITEEDLADILTHSQGLKKNVPLKAQYLAVLNKCDLPGAKRAGEKIQKLLSDRGCKSILLSCEKTKQGGSV